MASYRLTAESGSFALAGKDIGTPIVRVLKPRTGGFIVFGKPILFLAEQGGGTLYRWTGEQWAKVL